MKNSENIPGKNPFKVPENYFEEVNRRIISATVGEDEKPVSHSLYRRIRPYMLAAAAFTGFVIISYFTARAFITGEMDTESSLAETVSVTYLNDIDIYSIEESALELELSDGLSGIKKSDIVDYLMHEDIKTEDIIEIL
ncbi:MAG: hypothetical protein HZB98_08630 [Bacteroidia bacterium]|nr:hypothetical protein [Bacteroidia bacterium]